ncbi:MAG: restriction endonuclease subunit S [Oscillospiraceae bacterium]|nr:restriction endonuclease subunit S [Oscillospiraceae bacterium]
MREMKDSGVEWIGKIPDKWETILKKNLFTITRGRVIAKTEIEEDSKENYYPVYSSQTANNGILGYIPTYDYSVDSLTWTTDGAKAGTVFLRKGKYSITNVCGILIPKSLEHNLGFLHYAVSYSAHNCRRADINGYKIMSNEMAVIPITFPSKEEQQAIAAHLDRKCSQIDTLISNAQ